MTVYKLDLCPVTDGYSFQRGVNYFEVATDAGNSRIRRFRKNAEHVVNVTWLTDKNGFDFLQAFYRLWESQTPVIEHFLMDLVIDFNNLTEYRCWFTQGSPPNLASVRGNAYTVNAQIRCRAKKIDQNQDEMIILGVLDLTNMLEQLVNNDLPNAIEDYR